MKRIVGLIILIACATYADSSFREFTTEDGRTLMAKVINYNTVTDKVVIQRDNRKTITVKSSVFSEKDQRYIKSWSAAETFLSPSKFKLDIKRNEEDKSKKPIDVDIGKFMTGYRGENIGIVTVAHDMKTRYKYDLVMKNNTDTPLENIQMEYRIYYAQEKAVKDEKFNKYKLKDVPSPDKHNAVSEEKAKKGKSKIKLVEAKSSASKSTVGITLLKRSASQEWGENIDLKHKMHGVWIKLTIKGPDGDKIVREIAYPKGILKKFSWDIEEEVEEPKVEEKKENKPEEEKSTQ